MFEDYKTLKNDLKIIPKNLRKKIPGDDFTVEQAVRAYIWNKQGMEIPGLDNADTRELISYVANNNELDQPADTLTDTTADPAAAPPTHAPAPPHARAAHAAPAARPLPSRHCR